MSFSNRCRNFHPEAGEELMHWVDDLALKAPFAIKTTEAPYYRRVAVQRMREPKGDAETRQRATVYNGFGVRDGHGIMFVSHKGDVYPSGFLPESAGNVRERAITEICRNSELFRALDDTEQLKGKCDDCEYRQICGGSRARAFARTGDPLHSDPFCSYQPAQKKRPS